MNVAKLIAFYDAVANFLFQSYTDGEINGIFHAIPAGAESIGSYTQELCIAPQYIT
jgi:hypothetical protein